MWWISLTKTHDITDENKVRIITIYTIKTLRQRLTIYPIKTNRLEMPLFSNFKKKKNKKPAGRKFLIN